MGKNALLLIILRFNGFGRMGDCVELGDLQGFFWEGGERREVRRQITAVQS
jgi:hypothetical protein